MYNEGCGSLLLEFWWMWYSGRRIPAARVQRVLKTFKLETRYRCRWVARAQRNVCAVTEADRSVAGSLSLKSLEHVKSLFFSSGVPGCTRGDLPAANISKTIKCVPMKFSQVDGTIKLNIRYSFAVMATNCDVIWRHQSVRKIRTKACSGLFFAVRLTYISYHINI